MEKWQNYCWHSDNQHLLLEICQTEGPNYQHLTVYGYVGSCLICTRKNQPLGTIKQSVPAFGLLDLQILWVDKNLDTTQSLVCRECKRGFRQVLQTLQNQQMPNHSSATFCQPSYWAANNSWSEFAHVIRHEVPAIFSSQIILGVRMKKIYRE